MKTIIAITVVVGLLLWLIVSSFESAMHTKLPSLHNDYQLQVTQASAD